MIKKSKTITMALTLVLFALMLTACGNEQQIGAWIDNHIQKSGDKLESYVQESQELIETDDSGQPEQQTSSWIVNHIRNAGDKLIQHIERSEERLDSMAGKD